MDKENKGEKVGNKTKKNLKVKLVKYIGSDRQENRESKILRHIFSSNSHESGWTELFFFLVKIVKFFST